MRKTKVTVTQDEKAPVSVEVLAKGILQISEGIKKLVSGPLNEKCLVLLIQNAAPKKVGVSAVKAVLDGIKDLEETYLKVAP